MSSAIDLDTHFSQSINNGFEGELHDELYNLTMEWGSYKPNIFFGIKNRSPQPTTVGMAWAVPDVVRRTMDIRHTYKYQSNDGVSAYFEYHDGWSMFKEIIEDP